MAKVLKAAVGRETVSAARAEVSDVVAGVIADIRVSRR